ncbi:MAG: nitrilase-related carbon-nitrogen hydrolase [Leptospiraceae bacterium]
MAKKKKKKSGGSSDLGSSFLNHNYTGYSFYLLGIPLAGYLFSLSLAPVSSGWAGLGSMLIFMALARYIYRGSPWLMLFTAWLLSLSFQLFAFYWIPGTIQFYAGTSREAATVYALLYSLVYQLRVLILFAGFWLSFRFTKTSLAIVALAALLGDGLAPQVFNWYWGNMTEGWELWSQLAALGGVFLPGALLPVLVRLLYDLLAEVLSLRNKGPGILNLIQSYLKEPGSSSRDQPVAGDSSSQSAQNESTLSSSVRWKCSLSTAVLLLLILIHGFWNVYRVEKAIAVGKDRGSLNVAMLQTGTSRKMLGSLSDYDHAASSMNRVVNQSLEVIQKSGAALDLIILPESAIPYHGISPGQKGYSVTMHSLLSFIYGTAQTPLLFNQLQHNKQDESLTYNTASLMDPGHRTQQHYRKRVLIPYGEYLPLETVFPWLRSIFPGAGRYSPENRDQNLTMDMTYYPDRPRVQLLTAQQAGLQDPASLWANPGDSLRAGSMMYSKSLGESPSESVEFSYRRNAKNLKFALLICYEDLIPELSVSAFLDESPDFIVNISNDSWLSDKRAMQQHYGAARFRAIETGRFLLRTTLTGISGIMDPAGRDYVEPTEVNQRGTLVEKVPLQGSVQTLYASLGPWAWRIQVLLSLLVLGFIALTVRLQK